MATETKGQHRKWESLLLLSAVALALIWANLLAQNRFFRIDLTEEKRFTLSEGTQGILQNLDDVVYVEVFLEGDLNAGFKRLQSALRETLEEFRVHGGENIQFKFTNPDEQPNEEAKNRFYRQLADKGIPPTTLYDNIDGKRTQKIIFPGALISYKGKETALTLLKGQKAASPQEQLNQSAEGAEYSFIAAIKKLSAGDKKSIAILDGNGELAPQETFEMEAALNEFYTVARANPETNSLEGFDAIIMAQPKNKFSDLAKFAIDQYIMRGGKALFFVDQVQMNLDSIAKGGTYAFAYDLDLTDMFFKYGVRLNPDLIQDQQAGALEVVTGYIGDKPDVQRLPWPYHAFINNYAKHPAVRNLDAVQLKFFGSIDTVKSEGIRKTPLMFTSKYSRIKKTPSMVDLNELKKDLDQSLYTQSYLPAAYMLEGIFPSAYALRNPPEGAKTKEITAKSTENKIFISSDGDFVKNDFDLKANKPLPLGFDKNSRQTFGNKELLLNVLEYMLDGKGIIASRSKEVRLRPMDTAAIKADKTFWQALNLVLPLALIAAFGAAMFYVRKKKYEKRVKSEE